MINVAETRGSTLSVRVDVFTLTLAISSASTGSKRIDISPEQWKDIKAAIDEQFKMISEQRKISEKEGIPY